MKYAVLLTCVGGEYGPELINQLKAAHRDLRVIGVDADSGAIGGSFADYFYQVPRGDDPRYLGRINEIVHEQKIDLIVPTSDEEAIALSENKAAFSGLGVTVACINPETLKIFADKVKTYSAFRELNLAAPQFALCNDRDELMGELILRSELNQEVVVKPPSARGGRGVVVIRRDLHEIVRLSDRREVHCGESWIFDKQNAAILEELFPKFPVMVMERLVEPVYDLDLLAWEGKPIYIVPRKRIDSGAPNKGHEIVFDEKLIELGKSLIERFELSWLYDCDVMFDTHGFPVVVEINPRQSGSVAVTEAAGLPIFSSLVRLARGLPVETKNIPYGIEVLPRSTLFSVKR